MTLLDATTTVVDAARQLPPNKYLDRAIRRMEQRIELLRRRQADNQQRKAWLAARYEKGLSTECHCGGSLRQADNGAVLCRDCNRVFCPDCESGLGANMYYGRLTVACQCGFIGNQKKP